MNGGGCENGWMRAVRISVCSGLWRISASEWLDADCDPGFLLRGTRLDHFEAWVQESSMVLTENESEFLEASLAERKQREAQEAERLAHGACPGKTFSSISCVRWQQCWQWLRS